MARPRNPQALPEVPEYTGRQIDRVDPMFGGAAIMQGSRYTPVDRTPQEIAAWREHNAAIGRRDEALRAQHAHTQPTFNPFTAVWNGVTGVTRAVVGLTGAVISGVGRAVTSVGNFVRDLAQPRQHQHVRYAEAPQSNPWALNRGAPEHPGKEGRVTEPPHYSPAQPPRQPLVEPHAQTRPGKEGRVTEPAHQAPSVQTPVAPPPAATPPAIRRRSDKERSVLQPVATPPAAVVPAPQATPTTQPGKERPIAPTIR